MYEVLGTWDCIPHFRCTTMRETDSRFECPAWGIPLATGMNGTRLGSIAGPGGAKRCSLIRPERLTGSR